MDVEFDYIQNIEDMIFLCKRAYGPDYQCNYLFLDFDGVINVPYNDERDYQEEWVFKANIYAMDYLNELCKEFNLKLIISSSWRSMGMEWLEEYLRKSGLDESIKIIGTTDYDDFFRRYQEIYDYLVAHPNFTSLLILDDSPMGPLDKYLLRTTFDTGFKEEQLLLAREMLTKQLEDTF
ncbi:MAG: hypothetical protein HUJ56_03050 [Erysipelotrichaceae bacterium]|nr:hypothetical protein [Erysipelotrichaceae bacterium]